MVDWNSKLVSFLSDNNCVIIRGVKEFISFNSLLKKCGLDLFHDEHFYSVCDRVRRYCGNDYKLGINTLIVEYNNGKGLCLGWNSIESAKAWYEQEPYTVKEILEEVKS